MNLKPPKGWCDELGNWEIGIDIYTLIFIKWITNKKLLYKKINETLKFKTNKQTNKTTQGPSTTADGLNQALWREGGPRHQFVFVFVFVF